MNFDASLYVPVRMTEAQLKEYRAAAAASGSFHDSAPMPDPANCRMSRLIYNPITHNYTLDYHQGEIVCGEKDERGYARTDCDDYSEPDEPDRVYIFDDDSVPLPPRASEDEKADKKRNKETKKKKKTQAPNLDGPKDNTSSPTTMRRSDSIKTLADKNLDPSASTACEDEKADKKRKRTNKTKKKKKIQATNLEEPRIIHPPQRGASRLKHWLRRILILLWIHLHLLLLGPMEKAKPETRDWVNNMMKIRSGSWYHCWKLWKIWNLLSAS